MGTSQPYLTTISEQEAQLAELRNELSLREQEIRVYQATSSSLRRRIEALRTLGDGLFSLLDRTDIYALACKSLVVQLGWQSAFVVSITAEGSNVLAHFQATQAQLSHLEHFLHATPAFCKAYNSQQDISTFKGSDKQALSLRVLFGTDDVAATPLRFGGTVYGYLVGCAHGTDRIQSEEEQQFLSTVAAIIAHAVQNSGQFTSLESQNAKLQELDELKNSFISITSHQLRTPLSIIKWIFSILSGDPHLASLPEQLELIRQANESNERLIHVVTDLLNASRIEDGRLPYSPQPTDVRQLLEDLAHSVDRFCLQRGLTFTLTLPDQLPTLQADNLLLREAVQDLLDNAIDYNNEGGKVTLSAVLEKHTLEISVLDTGMGVTPSAMGQIFSQFYRSKEAMLRKPNGSGLGLYLVRAIAEQHGGTVTCQSKPDIETVFTISLPLA